MNARKIKLKKYMFIVNPASSNGTTGKKWPEHKKQFEEALGEISYEMTNAPRHATKLVRTALQEGYQIIVSVGGDGTMNEVLNGFLNDQGEQINPNAHLTVFSLGTGCDFIKTLEQKKGIEEVIAVLKREKEKIIDVGWLIATETDKQKRYYLNIADSGLGGATTSRVNKKTKILKGFLSFFLASIHSLYIYKDKKAIVVLDGKTVATGLINSVIVANGKYFGGGMKIAPDALLDDGLLDVIVIHHMSKPLLFKSFLSIYKGNHINNPYCSFYKGRHVIIKAGENKMLTELDGEQVGTIPAEFGILPCAIRIFV